MGAVSSRDFPAECRGFFKVFEQAVSRHHADQVFADWLQAAFAAFAHQMMEDSYMEAIRRYNKAEVELFAHMLGEWMAAQALEVKTPDMWSDVLGTIYEGILSHWKAGKMGQFFTPKSVCDMSAPIVGSKPRGSVCDPACGSGRMLLSHHAAHREDRCYYVGVDLDPMCVRMAALNMVIHGVRGEVVWANSLSNEIKGVWLVNPYLETLGIPGIYPAGTGSSVCLGGEPPMFSLYREARPPKEPGRGTKPPFELL